MRVRHVCGDLEMAEATVGRSDRGVVAEGRILRDRSLFLCNAASQVIGVQQCFAACVACELVEDILRLRKVCLNILCSAVPAYVVAPPSEPWVASPSGAPATSP